MRKYFKPSNLRKRSPNKDIDHEISPWQALESFVKDSASLLGFENTASLLSVINREDVAGYLDLASSLEEQSLMKFASSKASVCYALRQSAAFIKKFPFQESNLSTSPRDKAIEALVSAEEQCKATNEKFRSDDLELPRWFRKAKKLASDVLGPLDPDVVMKIIRSGKHGPGSTLSNKGGRVTEYYKYFDIPYTVTERCRPYAFAAISSDPMWMEYLESTGCRKEIPPFGSRLQSELMLLNEVVDVVANDSITFVPKTAKTDRPIAVGASLNMFLQLGVKSYMEDRLKKFGVDLTSQKKNQYYAYLGSKFAFNRDGSVNPSQFSTIDLASASDTISYELVSALLPPDWVAFLDDLRHDSGELDGRVIHYEKFSAMGNGYTFPLESLIFFCICKAAVEDAGFPCTPSDISIFGDDIIIRYKASSAVIQALEWSGFTVNTEKSFLSGSFKESCGSDFLNGTDVRPFYLKRRVTKYKDIYFICNSIFIKKMNFDYRLNLDSLYQLCISRIPLRDRNYGPLEFSESYLAVPLSYLSSQGLRPWLSEMESSVIDRCEAVSFEGYSNTPHYVDFSNSPKYYRTLEHLRYRFALRLKELPLTRPFWRPFDPIIDDVTGRATRRNSLREVIAVRSVHDWSCGFSSHLQYRFPIHS